MSADDLAQVVLEGMNEVPLERETLALLQAGLPTLTQREYSPDGVIAGQTAARLGYLARAAEYAMFDGELPPEPGIVQALGERLEEAESQGGSTWDAMGELAAEMAIMESIDPSRQEGGPSWDLDGLDGSSRGALRDSLVARLKFPPEVISEDLRRTWKYGYFLRVLDELCED